VRSAFNLLTTRIASATGRQKAIKKDRKLKRIESSEHVKYILNAAIGKIDYDLLSLLTVDDVQEKAQYHSACITNYLLKWKKDRSADNYSTIKNESEHDIAFKNLAVEYFVDKPSGSKEQHLSNKEDIYIYSKRFLVLKKVMVQNV
jgi:hypothetical protein